MTVYGDPHKIEFFGLLVDAIRSVRPAFGGPPIDPPSLPFQLQDPHRLEEELAAAGLRDVQVETITEATEFRSGQALWDWFICSNPIVEEVLEALVLTAKERDVIQGTLEALVRERASSTGSSVLTNPINIGVGTT
jgi:hypothetical protein